MDFSSDSMSDVYDFMSESSHGRDRRGRRISSSSSSSSISRKSRSRSRTSSHSSSRSRSRSRSSSSSRSRSRSRRRRTSSSSTINELAHRLSKIHITDKIEEALIQRFENTNLNTDFTAKTFFPKGFVQTTSEIVENEIKKTVHEHQLVNTYSKSIFRAFKQFQFRFKKTRPLIAFISGTRAWEYWFKHDNIKQKVHNLQYIEWPETANYWIIGGRYVFELVINTYTDTELKQSIQEIYRSFVHACGVSNACVTVNNRPVRNSILNDVFETDPVLRFVFVVYDSDVPVLKVVVHTARVRTNERTFENVVHHFKKLIIRKTSKPFLNKDGLAFFQVLEHMPWKRVQMFRYTVLEHFLTYDPLVMSYQQYVSLYEHTQLYDQDVYQSLVIKYCRVKEKDVSDALDTIETYLVERFRPYINSCIRCMNRYLRSYGGQQSYAFIAGGDAFERYIPTGTSKDIDIKVVYEQGDYKKVYRIVVDVCADLIDKLEIEINKTKQETITFTDRVHFQTNNIICRLRHLDDTKFPVNLLSVDIRCYIDIQDLRYKHNLALLDVVFVENGKHESIHKKEMTIAFENELLIASPKFLTLDLFTMYSTADKMILRWNNHKTEKDKKRYNNILKITETFEPYTFIHNSRNRANIKRLNVFIPETLYNCAVSPYGAQYSDLFQTLHADQKMMKSKHKIPFGTDDIDELFQKYESKMRS